MTNKPPGLTICHNARMLASGEGVCCSTPRQSTKSKKMTDQLVAIFFPLHWLVRRLRPAQMLLSRVSPCLVYLQAYPQLSRDQHYEWCRLDTYDHLTDYYKHLRTTNQIRATLASLNAQDVWVSRGGNGVEARCRKPEN